jgi:hypothetical protein
MTDQDQDLTPGQRRVQNAILANRRRREARLADELVTKGWVCIPPEEAGKENPKPWTLPFGL